MSPLSLYKQLFVKAYQIKKASCNNWQTDHCVRPSIAVLCELLMTYSAFFKQVINSYCFKIDLNLLLMVFLNKFQSKLIKKVFVFEYPALSG